MVKFKGLLVSALLIGIFIFAIINASIHFTASNDVDNPLMENPAFNETFGELQTELSKSQSQTQEQLETQQQTDPKDFSGEIIIETIPRTAYSFVGMMRNIYNLTFGLISTTLGIDPLVSFVITAILILSITLLIWRLIKTGE